MTQPATHELVQGCILDKRKISMNSETDRYIQLANCFFVAAEKELSAFMSAVLKLFGPEQARQSALRWIEELERMDSPSGESIPDWRRACSRGCRKHCQDRCSCTDPNFLCYNSFTGQGQLLWVSVACTAVLDCSLAWCPWCPLTSEFGFMGMKQAT